MANRRRRDPRPPQGRTETPSPGVSGPQSTAGQDRVDPVAVAHDALSLPATQAEPDEAPMVSLLRKFTAARPSADVSPSQTATPEHQEPGGWVGVGEDGQALDPLAITRAALAAGARREAEAADEALFSMPSASEDPEEPAGTSSDPQASVDKGEHGAEAQKPARRTRRNRRPKTTSTPVVAEGDEPLVAERSAQDPADQVGEQVTDQVDAASASGDSSTPLTGWVYHRLDENGFQGWLFHYSDGTSVKEDGTPYTPTAPVPTNDEPAASAAPTTDPDTSSSGDALRVDDSAADTTSAAQDEPADAVRTAPPTSDADGGWVYHSGDETNFEGWLYHYADGTLATEDGTVHDPSATTPPQSTVEVVALTTDVDPAPVEYDVLPTERADTEPSSDVEEPPASAAPPDDARSASLGSLIAAMTGRRRTTTAADADTPAADEPPPAESEPAEVVALAHEAGESESGDGADTSAESTSDAIAQNETPALTATEDIAGEVPSSPDDLHDEAPADEVPAEALEDSAASDAEDQPTATTAATDVYAADTPGDVAESDVVDGEPAAVASTAGAEETAAPDEVEVEPAGAEPDEVDQTDAAASDATTRAAKDEPEVEQAPEEYDDEVTVEAEASDQAIEVAAVPADLAETEHADVTAIGPAADGADDTASEHIEDEPADVSSDTAELGDSADAEETLDETAALAETDHAAEAPELPAEQSDQSDQSAVSLHLEDDAAEMTAAEQAPEEPEHAADTESEPVADEDAADTDASTDHIEDNPVEVTAAEQAPEEPEGVAADEPHEIAEDDGTEETEAAGAEELDEVVATTEVEDTTGTGELPDEQSPEVPDGVSAAVPADGAAADPAQGDEVPTEGWVYHQSADSGFEGWLYHYPDGSMVSEDGTVFEYAGSEGVEVDAGSAIVASAAQPSDLVASTEGEVDAETSDTPPAAAVAGTAVEPARKTGRFASLFGRGKRTGPVEEPTPVEPETPVDTVEDVWPGTADTAESAPGDGDAEVEPTQDVEAEHVEAEHVEAENVEAEDVGGEDVGGEDVEAQSTEAESTDHGAADQDEHALLVHETQDGEDDAEGSEEAIERDTAEETPADAGEPQPGADADADADTRSGSGSDETDETEETEETEALQAGDEDETPAPVAAISDAVNDVLVSEKTEEETAADELETASASAAETDRDTDGGSDWAPEWEPEWEPEPHPEPKAAVPGFVEWSPTNLRRYVLGSIFLVTSVASVLAILYAVQESSRDVLFLAAVLVALSMGSWWALLSWVPTIVTIRDGILEVARGPHGHKYDLRDPSTAIQVGENVSSPTWKAVIREDDGEDVVIRSGHVKPRQFAEIVAYHRRHPHPAESDAESSED